MCVDTCVSRSAPGWSINHGVETRRPGDVSDETLRRSGIQMYDDKWINSLFSLKNCEGDYCMLEAFHAPGWYLAAHREVRAMHGQGHRVWLRNGNCADNGRNGCAMDNMMWRFLDSGSGSGYWNISQTCSGSNGDDGLPKEDTSGSIAIGPMIGGAVGLVVAVVISVAIVMGCIKRAQGQQQQQHRHAPNLPRPQFSALSHTTSPASHAPGNVEMVSGVVQAVLVGQATPVVGSTSASPMASSLPLIEQVAILKRELGVTGTIRDVVHEAAIQLGIQVGDRPINEISVQCLQAIGAATTTCAAEA